MIKYLSKSKIIFISLPLLIVLFCFQAQPAKAIDAEIVADPIGWAQATITATNTATQLVYTLQQIQMQIQNLQNIDSNFSSSQLNSLQQTMNTMQQAMNQNAYAWQQAQYAGNAIQNYINATAPSQSAWNSMTYQQQQNQLQTNSDTINNQLGNNIKNLQMLMNNSNSGNNGMEKNAIVSNTEQIKASSGELQAIKSMAYQLTTLTQIAYDNKQILGQIADNMNTLVNMQNQQQQIQNADNVTAVSDPMQISNTPPSNYQKYYNH